MRVGVDIVSVKRFKKMKNLDAFLKKYFTNYEINYIGSKKNKFETISGIYASKEAFLKALKIGIGAGVSLINVEVKHNNNGAPFIEKKNMVLATLKENQLESVELSISHTKKMAIATCILF